LALHLVVVQALALAVQLGTFLAPTLAVVLKEGVCGERFEAGMV
jgi:uncharacterized membrane protein YqaE (UPF0057 family)